MEGKSEGSHLEKFLTAKRHDVIPTVECPVCGNFISKNSINVHVEECLQKSSSRNNEIEQPKDNTKERNEKFPEGCNSTAAVVVVENSILDPQHNASSSKEDVTSPRSSVRKTKLKLKKPVQVAGVFIYLFCIVYVLGVLISRAMC
jgi:hypothetical protein